MQKGNLPIWGHQEWWQKILQKTINAALASTIMGAFTLVSFVIAMLKAFEHLESTLTPHRLRAVFYCLHPTYKLTDGSSRIFLFLRYSYVLLTIV